MSSHHFVKEGQEPILIVGNGELCSYEKLTQLLEWSPKIVALDGAADKLQSLQIIPDVVIGDMDSTKSKETQSTAYIKIRDQNTTDLEKALNHFTAEGSTSFTLLGCTGKRLDHTINNLMSLAKYAHCEITLYDNYSRLVLLNKSYSKQYRKGSAISLIPLPIAKNITSTNLMYSLDNVDLELTKLSGTSNAVSEDGIVTINYQEGLLCLIESFDEVQ